MRERLGRRAEALQILPAQRWIPIADGYRLPRHPHVMHLADPGLPVGVIGGAAADEHRGPEHQNSAREFNAQDTVQAGHDVAPWIG
jgi:hypothetical protein